MKNKFDTVIHHDNYSDETNRHVSKERVCVNIYTKIPCGQLRFLDDDLEGYVEIPYSMIGPGEFFILRASGDSMINAGIFDSDLVLIKKQNYADDGQIVVAISDNDVTLKRIHFDKKGKKYHLSPENDDYTDIVLDEVKILGVAVSVVKKL